MTQEQQNNEMNNPMGNGPQQQTPWTPDRPETKGERTPIEAATESARAQAGQAAEAFRRGEFMHESTADPAANADDRLIGLLAYVTQLVMPLVMPIIVLLSESSKQRPFQRFHAIQSLALTGIFIFIGIMMGMATLVTQIIPPLGMVVFVVALCLTPVLYGMYAIAQLYYGYQAYQGRRFAIPGLTNFLRDQKWV